MAMSREIPINVHPEYRRQTTGDQQGKPRIFTRSSSLPSGPKLKLVVETSDPNGADVEQVSKPEQKQTAAEYQSQGTNGTKSNQNYNFWESSSPVGYPKMQHFCKQGPCKHNVPDGKEQRRHFFAENPFIGDLEKVFEDQYTSDLRRPVKLGRRNTYSEGSSRETQHSDPKIGRNSSERNKKEISFDIPVKVEFEEMKDGNEIEKKSSRESHLSEPKIGKNLSGRNRMETSFDVPFRVEIDEIKEANESEDKDIKENKEVEKASLQDEEETTKPVSEVVNEQKTRDTFRIDEPYTVLSFDGTNYCNNTDKGQILDNSEDDIAGEINEGEGNTEQGQVVIEIGEQSASTLLPKEFTEENESNLKNKLLIIQSILKKAEVLEKKVDDFSDNSKTKEYLILEEILTCCLIELDGIETNQDENIRLARKTAVQRLQRTLAQLEQKVSCTAVEKSEEGVKDESSKRDHNLENNRNEQRREN
ncbi:hypothetical protein ACROYT_G021852, partial [Oculina patagonica]